MKCLYSTFQIYTICQRENDLPDFQERAFWLPLQKIAIYLGLEYEGTEGTIRGDQNKETVQKQTAIGILVIDVLTAV